MANKKKETLFEQLSAIDVGENTEKKGKFTYLSWAWAWAELMKVKPDSTYELLPIEYHNDGSVTVHTRLTIDGISHQMYLPVMNYSNKAVINPNAMDINKARMRCLVKNIAMFGLGLYIYAGEDLPEKTDGEKAEVELVGKDHVKVINEMLKAVGRKPEKLCNYLKVDSIRDLTIEQYNQAVAMLTPKKIEEVA